jgi:DNA-binding MarR family transcriptional regulator
MATDKSRLAADVWKHLFDLLMRTSGERTRILSRNGLTPNDSRALMTLDVARGRTMRSLAAEWECDASNATFIIDRLEARGYARRLAMEGDRRIKWVRLTPSGLRVRRRVLEGMYKAPAELLDLPRTTLVALHRALTAGVSEHR